MLGQSRQIQSTQTGIHPDLLHWVIRARNTTEFRKPIASFNAEAFAVVCEWLGRLDTPWVLDSGCGTGHSSLLLAEQNPTLRVVGVDRSAHRLRRTPETHARILWVRADLVDFWRLLAASPWRPQTHYLLYPNPYPKPQHIKQRWHAHPVFPALLECSPTLICRTNWHIYAQELQQALQVFGVDASLQEICPKHPMTAFERKYLASNHTLWEVCGSQSR